MLYIAAISLAFFLTIVLFTKRDKTKADGILAFWLLIIGIHLVQYYLDITVEPYYTPYLMIGFPLPLFHGPMLFFYTSYLTNQHSYLKKYWFFHFAPVVLVYVLMIPFFLLTHSEKILVFERRGEGFVFVLLVQRILVYASGVVYVILSLWLLRNHKLAVRDRFSQLEKINLIWLRYLIYGMGLQWIAVFYGNDRIIFSMVALFVMLLGYFGIKQVGIFTESSLSSATVDIELDQEISISKTSIALQQPKGRYLKSTLSTEAQRAIHEKLVQSMEAQKLFLNPELTVTELANRLGVHPNHLSQVINSIESKTFYDFINRSRIEEFMKIVALPENQKYTLLALAFECGFSSKTAFYRNFKNVTGQSPTFYLRQRHIQVHPD